MTSTDPPAALMAIAISVAPARQGERLSGRMIETFRDNARAAGLSSVLAPVRPTLKERYPLIPIERYLEWRREDGAHFDPWIRIHEHVGGQILAPAPESMTIRKPVPDWEEWTGMRFPEDGEYVFPGGLATLLVQDGVGVHVEPNVWVLHGAEVRGDAAPLLGGQREADPGTATLAVLCPDPPAVGLDQPSRDREAEACSSRGARAVSAPEALEHPRLRFDIEAFARVFDSHAHLAGKRLDPDGDGSV
jgi:hypothetical protein